MSLINETRRVGGTGAFLNCHRQRASDNPNYPPKLAPDQAEITARREEVARRLRLQFLAGRLHGLGERPLFHFLDEVERGAPLRPHLERGGRR